MKRPGIPIWDWGAAMRIDNGFLKAGMLALFLGCIAGAGAAAAQDAPPPAADTALPAEVQLGDVAMPADGEAYYDANTAQAQAEGEGAPQPLTYRVDPENIASLFFTEAQSQLIAEARRGLLARLPDSSELSSGQPGSTEPGTRELSLGGIVYHDAKDWVVWLNNTRMTPKALLPQITDLKVRPDYIEIAWYDEYTQQIYPVRLRPQQRFNLDARLFLPGVGSGAGASSAGGY